MNKSRDGRDRSAFKLILGIAGGDGAHGTCALARTAHDAGIGNLVSHSLHLHV